MNYFFLISLAVAGLTIQVAADIPVLAWTPRSDWVDVTKNPYNADKTGATDATAAIQTALNAVASGVTIYFPPGTYRITTTLALPGGRPSGVSLVGNGPSSVLAWYGASGGTLLTDPGCPHSLFIGLKFDGRNIAAIGFDNNDVYFDTESRWQHVAFQNFTASGLQSNPTASSFLAEASFENCVFNACGNGINITKYNDYDFTISGCDFINCGYGINCTDGNYYARDCYFQGSTVGDVLTRGAEHGCSVRRSVSTASAQFINFSSSVAPLDVQDCHVSGWTGTSGAIVHTASPLVLHNNRFVNPPDTAPPVRCPSGNAQRILVCNNSAPQSTALLSASGPAVYTIPAGTYDRNIAANGSGISSFVNANVTVPSVVYDAKAYGALGNGVADDTAAIQQTIDAARSYGQGSIAYLPKGNYIISSTINITGSNYIVGGSGYKSCLIWRGAAGGTMVSVSNPQNLKLENINVGQGDSGPMTNAVDILQTSAEGSFMTYSGVCVYGCYSMQPETKGLLLNGLGSGSVVVLNGVQGNLRMINSARATILGSITYEGTISLDDSTSTVRDGFLGFMTRLSTLNTYPIIVRNNNSMVMSDYYTEQGQNGPSISGVTGNPSGRITLNGAKTQYTQSGTNTCAFLTVDNYQGNINYGSNQFYLTPSPMPIVQTGTRALDITLLATVCYNTSLSLSTSGSATVHAIGNIGFGNGAAPADNYTAQTPANVTAAFDDLQRLGNLDLSLNFPNLARSLYYKLNEGNGITLADSSGHGNTGHLANGPVWTTGIFGKALSFNGTTAYAYSSPTTGIPVGNTNQTISWWQYVTANPGAEMVAVCLKNSSAGTGLCTGYKSGLFGAWKYEDGSWLLSSAVPSINTWHHCAYTFDGTTHRLYVDGAEAANSTATPNTSIPTVVCLAARGGWTGASNFSGKIDDVSIFQRALSPSEIGLINIAAGYYLTISGDLTDPDGDGICKLMDYALNLNPNQAAIAGLPGSATTIVNGTTCIDFTHRMNTAATDIVFGYEQSTDLVTWTPAVPTLINTVSLDSTTNLVTMRIFPVTPPASTPRMFLRMRVTRP